MRVRATIKRGTQEIELECRYDEEHDTNAALLDIDEVWIDGKRAPDAFELTDDEHESVLKQCQASFFEGGDD